MLSSRSFLSMLRQSPDKVGNASFQQLSATSQREVLAAVRSLRSYIDGYKATMDRRRRLFSKMSWRQQEICDKAGYKEKLKQADHFAAINHQFLSAVANYVAEEYQLTKGDVGSADSNLSGSHYRVCETLGHFARDWSDTAEIAPLVEYITGQLDKVIPKHEQAETVVIVPGSGLGRLAHEIAVHGDYQVYAVEYSGLMHLCHKYIYTGIDNTEIHPYIHTCSNFPTKEAQFRPVTVVPQKQPDNLHVEMDDFRYFKLPQLMPMKNVVVATAFFIDTAENLMDYFDAINVLTSSPNRGYWINIGPLKYGSAPQVELTAEEIALVRKEMGWEDVDNETEVDSVVGYITDKQSMWQGYYGLAKWTSKRKIE